ncbi:MAG: DUF4180 domain-containing protein [Microscillaceae bacterium]|jgi:hypothetical protein|nr:DUF4180 domain-containing protein [Microscillaceae bacterium]
MELNITAYKGYKIAELITENTLIQNTQEAVELVVNSQYLEAEGLIVQENQLHPDFFDLRTQMAGDILQKFSNYRAKLAIVGDFTKYQSQALKDFIRESNQAGRISFVSSIEEALEALIQF